MKFFLMNRPQIQSEAVGTFIIIVTSLDQQVWISFIASIVGFMVQNYVRPSWLWSRLNTLKHYENLYKAVPFSVSPIIIKL